MELNNTEVRQPPPIGADGKWTRARLAGVIAPGAALAIVLILAVCGPLWWFRYDALFMFVLGLHVLLVTLLMRRRAVRLRTRLLQSVAVPAVSLTGLYLSLGIPPLDVAVLAWLIATRRSLFF